MNSTNTPTAKVFSTGRISPVTGSKARWRDGFVDALVMQAFEWRLVAFTIGIALYFVWPNEPEIWMSSAAFMALLILAGFVRSRPVILEITLLLAFLGLGFGRTSLHATSIAAPVLPKLERAYTLTGWVEGVQASGPLQHFTIGVHKIERMAPLMTPYRVRVRAKPYQVKPGDCVSIKAVLSAPRAPVLAGGYDSARAAWFQRLGGSGFAVSKALVVNERACGQRSWPIRMARFRYALSRRIQAAAPRRTAGLQAALLTGDRSAIPPEQAQILRDAGLAHILAISGLHMGILAGGTYAFISWFLSLIGPLSRRYDMRKWAALAGILVATAYLLISGASISTTRAYIMAVVVFLAVIFDRRAFSLRAVAIAAALTLLLHPESLLSAGFQMSFAATAALVVVYRFWADRFVSEERAGLGKVGKGVLSLGVTSVVAGLATGGFAALHFHRFAKYGLFGNLAAMPVFTFVVMPLGFLAFLLMPFGLEAAPLKLMGLGVSVILDIANSISTRPGAIAHIKAANPLVIGLYGLGFAALVLGPKTARLAGLLLIISALFVWRWVPVPDMRISETAKIAFWDPQAVNVLRVDGKRGDRFGRARFVEKSGRRQAKLQKYTDTAHCDALLCLFELKGKKIAIAKEPEGVSEACARSDLVVLQSRQAGPIARRHCAARLIDARELATSGALDVYLSKKQIRIQPATPTARNRRLWGRVRAR